MVVLGRDDPVLPGPVVVLLALQGIESNSASNTVGQVKELGIRPVAGGVEVQIHGPFLSRPGGRFP